MTEKKTANGQRITDLEKKVEILERQVQELLARLDNAAEMIVEKLDRLDKMDHDLKMAIVNINRKLDAHLGASTIEHLMKSAEKP